MLFSNAWTIQKSRFFSGLVASMLSVKTWNSWTRSTRSQRASPLLQVTQSIPVRFVAISASFNDPVDVSRWLRIQLTNIFNFHPNDRDQLPHRILHSFTIPHSQAMFKSLIRLVHAILRANRGERVT